MKRPLLVMAAGCVFASCLFIVLKDYWLYFIMFALFLGFVMYRTRHKARIITFVIAFVVVGILISCKHHQIDKQFIDVENASQFRGKILSVKQKEHYCQYVLTSVITDRNTDISGKMLITSYDQKEDYSPGDIVSFSGALNLLSGPRNPGGFNGQYYYYGKGIYYSVSVERMDLLKARGRPGLVSDLAYRLEKRVDAAFSIEYTAFVKQVLLGLDSPMEDGLEEAFRETGLAHVLAISGLHLSIIILSLYQLLKKCIKSYYKEVLIVFITIFYVLITNMHISTIRAGGMLIVSFLAVIIIRRYDSLSALGLVLVIVLLVNPYEIMSVGLQLSVAAVLGILWLSKYIEPKLSVLPGVLRAYISPLIGIWLMTLPLLLYHFYHISLMSIVINMIAFPFIWLVIVFGLMAIVFYGLPIFEMLFYVVFRISYHILLAICEVFYRIDWQYILVGKPTILMIVLYYCVLLLLLIKMNNKSRELLKSCTYLMCFTVILMMLINYHTLNVTFLDVGQGDCASISYKGKVFLIDTGGKMFKTTKDNVGELVIKPYLDSRGVKCIDGIFITHTDGDHMTGLTEIVDDYDIKAIYLPSPYNQIEDDERYDAILYLAARFDIDVIYLEKGMNVTFDKLSFKCISPISDQVLKDNNDHSLVLEVSKGAFNALFTGDITMAVEEELIDGGHLDGLSSIEVLKVAHHGSKYSSTESFVATVDPQVACISYGSNVYGHPSSEIVARLESTASHVYKTKEDGAVTIYYMGFMVYYMDSMLVEERELYLCKP